MPSRELNWQEDNNNNNKKKVMLSFSAFQFSPKGVIEAS